MGLTAGQLKKSGFEAVCHSVFTVSVPTEPNKDSARIELTLKVVESRPSPVGYEQFSLLFQGPPQPVLPQSIYRFAHERVGEVDLFMVPIDRNAQGIQYEVCVSRSVEGG